MGYHLGYLMYLARIKGQPNHWTIPSRIPISLFSWFNPLLRASALESVFSCETNRKWWGRLQELASWLPYKQSITELWWHQWHWTSKIVSNRLPPFFLKKNQRSEKPGSDALGDLIIFSDGIFEGQFAVRKSWGSPQNPQKIRLNGIGSLGIGKLHFSSQWFNFRRMFPP